MTKSMIVCFAGMDGSGKTLHASVLLKKMKKRGYMCRYTWCRWSPGFSDVFHFVVRKTLGYVKEEYRFCKPLQKIFQCLKILDFGISTFFKVRMPYLLGYYVIVDRYLHDVLADMKFWGFDISNTDLFVRLLLETSPRPHLTFLIHVPPEVATSRKKDLSLREAREYKKIYDYMTKAYNFRKISNENFGEAHNEILEKLANFEERSVNIKEG